jgi:hypothetical protein
MSFIHAINASQAADDVALRGGIFVFSRQIMDRIKFASNQFSHLLAFRTELLGFYNDNDRFDGF